MIISILKLPLIFIFILKSNQTITMKLSIFKLSLISYKMSEIIDFSFSVK